MVTVVLVSKPAVRYTVGAKLKLYPNNENRMYESVFQVT